MNFDQLMTQPYPNYEPFTNYKIPSEEFENAGSLQVDVTLHPTEDNLHENRLILSPVFKPLNSIPLVFRDNIPTISLTDFPFIPDAKKETELNKKAPVTLNPDPFAGYAEAEADPDFQRTFDNVNSQTIKEQSLLFSPKFLDIESNLDQASFNLQPLPPLNDGSDTLLNNNLSVPIVSRSKKRSANEALKTVVNDESSENIIDTNPNSSKKMKAPTLEALMAQRIHQVDNCKKLCRDFLKKFGPELFKLRVLKLPKTAPEDMSTFTEIITYLIDNIRVLEKKPEQMSYQNDIDTFKKSYLMNSKVYKRSEKEDKRNDYVKIIKDEKKFNNFYFKKLKKDLADSSPQFSDAPTPKRFPDMVNVLICHIIKKIKEQENISIAKHC